MKGITIHHRVSPMNKISKSQFSLCAAAALATAIAVSGCSKAPEADQAAQTAPAAAAPVAEAPDMTTPLTQEQAGAQYAITAEPVLVNNGETLRTVVSVTNTGKVAISSKGKLPVNLAISLVDPSGEMVARDFVRASLPAAGIAAGASADVITEVPAKDVVGKSLRFGLVQEAIVWFSDFNVATVDYGPLTACDDQGKPTICGKDGKPLQHVAQ
ncbi:MULTISPECIES: glycosyltransferase [Stenotrophomonas]|nr:glycosyltransferase [Stenotrophomonas maltophilia]